MHSHDHRVFPLTQFEPSPARAQHRHLLPRAWPKITARCRCPSSDDPFSNSSPLEHPLSPESRWPPLPPRSSPPSTHPCRPWHLMPTHLNPLPSSPSVSVRPLRPMDARARASFFPLHLQHCRTASFLAPGHQALPPARLGATQAVTSPPLAPSPTRHPILVVTASHL